MKLVLMWLCGALICGHLFVAAQTEYRGISEKLPTGCKAVSPDGLTASFDFETHTKDGRLRDFGPFANHGRLARKSETAGRFGKALKFTVKEDVVILPDNESLGLEGPISVVAKLKITKPGLHQHVFAVNDLFVLWLTKADQYRFADTQGQGFTTKKNLDVVTKGEWHTVVAVLATTKGEPLDKDNIKIFINGELVAGTHEAHWGPTTLVSHMAGVIGGTRSGAQWHQDLQFEGILDELLIFSRALSNEEAKAFGR